MICPVEFTYELSASKKWRGKLGEAQGYSGLVDRRKGTASDKRVPLARVEEVLRLYREVYFDLNMRHFHEKLSEEHGIELSYTWVQKALQRAGLVARGKPGESTGDGESGGPEGSKPKDIQSGIGIDWGL